MINTRAWSLPDWQSADPLSWPDSLRRLLIAVPSLLLVGGGWLFSADLIERRQDQLLQTTRLTASLAERAGPIRDWRPFEAQLEQRRSRLDARLASLPASDSLAERLAALADAAARAGVELGAAQPAGTVAEHWPPAHDLQFQVRGRYAALERFALATSHSTPQLLLIPERIRVDQGQLVLEATARSHHRPGAAVADPADRHWRQPPPWLPVEAHPPQPATARADPPTHSPEPTPGARSIEQHDPFRLPGTSPVQTVASAAHPLQAHALEQLRLVGLLTSGNDSIALIETPDRVLHRADPGQQLGSERATIVAITPGGLQLRNAAMGSPGSVEQWLRVEVQR